MKYRIIQATASQYGTELDRMGLSPDDIIYVPEYLDSQSRTRGFFFKPKVTEVWRRVLLDFEPSPRSLEEAEEAICKYQEYLNRVEAKKQAVAGISPSVVWQEEL